MDIRVFDYGFEMGCGCSLSEALNTDRFSELLQANDTLMDRYPPESDQGVALRAGHLNMGTLLNSMEEGTALENAKHLLGEPRIEMRPLIQLFGEKIVETATKCLPREALSMALGWRGATAEEQYEMLRHLQVILRSTNQGQLGQDITMASALEYVNTKTSRNHGIETYLPRAYGMWDKDTCPAECQGKTQMVTAFARLAGARVMMACPIVDINNEITHWRIKAQELVKRDIFSRGLEIDSGLAESMTASAIYEPARLAHTNFHVGCAIELCDGQWVLVDPHGMTWGMFSEEWSVEAIYERLEKYEAALPGLHLAGNDGNKSTEILSDRFKQVEDLIARSRKMEERIKVEVNNFPDLVYLIAASDDLDLVLRLHFEENCEQMDTQMLSQEEVRQTTAFTMLSQGRSGLELLDPDFLHFSIQEWLTFYHALASGVFLNQIQEAGKTLHPVAEFALPEYNIAMAALNSLTIDLLEERTDAFFSDYSFCQTQLNNDLLHRRDLAEAAAKSLLALPYRHPICERTLRIKGYTR